MKKTISTCGELRSISEQAILDKSEFIIKYDKKQATKDRVRVHHASCRIYNLEFERYFGKTEDTTITKKYWFFGPMKVKDNRDLSKKYWWCDSIEEIRSEYPQMKTTCGKCKNQVEKFIKISKTKT